MAPVKLSAPLAFPLTVDHLNALWCVGRKLILQGGSWIFVRIEWLILNPRRVKSMCWSVHGFLGQSRRQQSRPAMIYIGGMFARPASFISELVTTVHKVTQILLRCSAEPVLLRRKTSLHSKQKHVYRAALQFAPDTL